MDFLDGRRRLALAVVVLVISTVACGDRSDALSDTSSPAPSLVLPPLAGGVLDPDAAVPPLASDRVARGRPLYDRHCASCHGANGEGAEDWMTPNPDGSFRPPPQDATGHTWHHADSLLIGIVNGSERFEGSVMPTFGDVLTDDEIVDVLEYIKTWWGDFEREVQWNATQQAGD